MRFNPSLFDRHLANIGQRVLWRQSFSCACVNPSSGQADPKHALCGGKGRIWNDPIATVAGVPSQATQAKWAAMGMYASGDLVLAIPQASPMWEAGHFDRITALDSTDAFSQPLVRGALSERLLFMPASITRVFWLDPVTRLPVAGVIPTVGADGIPVWAGGLGAPVPGVTYSITGTKHTEYFLFDNFPSDRNQHSGMRLPKRVVARQWDLFSR